MQMIMGLKRAGVPIKDIAYFVSWRLDGDDSLGERYDFLNAHEKVLEDEIASLEKSLAYLRFKKNGTTKRPRQRAPRRSI